MFEKSFGEYKQGGFVYSPRGWLWIVDFRIVVEQQQQENKKQIDTQHKYDIWTYFYAIHGIKQISGILLRQYGDLTLRVKGLKSRQKRKQYKKYARKPIFGKSIEKAHEIESDVAKDGGRC
jgi:hypothetical protein